MNHFQIVKKTAAVMIILLTVPLLALAVNDVQVSNLTYFELLTADTAAAVTITADGGGQVTHFDVESNYIDITLDNLSTVTFRTNVGNRFIKITKQSGSNDYTVSPACPTDTVTLTGTGASVILRLEILATDNCATPPSGGGGGGGGGSYTPLVTIIGFIKINNGASETLFSGVTLNLAAANATQMAISNDPNFVGGNWETYNATKSWNLIPGFGPRVVYAKFKSNGGPESPVVSASINVIQPIQPVPSATCQVACGHLTYDLYIINPDGSERHMDQARWAKKQILSDGSLLVSFEDKGLDNNYTDVIVQINTVDCSNITVSTLPSTARWHHQIKLKVYYDGALKDDLVLWQDSHLASDNPVAININSNQNVCAAPVTVPTSTVPYGALEALQYSPTINIDKNLNTASGTLPLCISGSLIKLPNDGDPATQQDSTVYYCGADSRRYVFPNAETYFTWYPDFSTVTLVSSGQMAAIPLGENVTVRPGSKLVRFLDNKVYAVAKGGILRWVVDDNTAQALYGSGWKTRINILADVFFGDYTVGDSINLADVIPGSQPPASTTFTSEPVSCQTSVVFTKFLSVGVNTDDPEVMALQKLLQCLGYLPAGTILTGHFGAATETAVKNFQAAYGIKAAGYIGPETRAALNKFVIPVK